jgi:bifunctional DNA-binding transcriptional regulator/antitoxin component of YhaV-PrlF toxin-antitoxin module
MTSLSGSTQVDHQTFSVTLQADGQITVPPTVQAQLSLSEGDQLTLLQIGEFMLLAPKTLRVNDLAEQITTLRETANLTLEELLDGLRAERTSLWSDNQPHA